MNARYYNPKTGRFLTQDAMGGDQWTNNLYTYCGNNPVSFKDPTGYKATITAGDSQEEDSAQKAERSKNKKETVSNPETNQGGEYYPPVDAGPGDFGQGPAYPDPNEGDKDYEDLKNNPNALTWEGSAASTYAGESDESIVARMLFGEDASSIEAHLWVLENRRKAGNYGGDNYRSLILARAQFGCMGAPKEGEKYTRSSNPGATFAKKSEKAAWDACVDAAYKLYSKGGINNFTKPEGKDGADFTYTWTLSMRIKGVDTRHPDGINYGGTWFYNK